MCPCWAAPRRLPDAPDLEVAHREAEARAQLRHLLDHAQAPLRRLVEPPVGGNQEVGVGLLALPSDAPAELVELGEAEAVGAIDDDGIGRRDVEPRLHDGRRDEDVDLAVHELDHDGLELALPHLAMAHGHPRVRDTGPWMNVVIEARDWMRLWTKKTWPPRRARGRSRP